VGSAGAQVLIATRSPATLLRQARGLGAAAVHAAPRQAWTGVAVLILLCVSEGAGLLSLVPLLGLAGVQVAGGALGGIERMFASGFAAVHLAPTLVTVLTLYVGLAVVQTSVQRWQTRLSADLIEAFGASLRTRVYRAMVGAEWVFLARLKASEPTYVLTEAVERSGVSLQMLVGLLAGVAVALAYLLMALRVSPRLTLIVLVAGALLAWMVRRRFGAARSAGQEWSNAATRLYAGIAEHLASLKTARSYGAIDRHLAAFGELVSAKRHLNVRLTAEYAGFRQRLTLGLTGLLAIVVYVARGVLAMPAAELLVLLFLFARLTPRITAIYESIQQMAGTLPAFAAVTAFEAKCLAAAEQVRPGEPARPLSDEIAFAAVTFAYQGDAAPALQDVTFTIPAGRTTAIVGPSGAGKSTAADLLLGLLSPTAGCVRVDGRELTAAWVHGWRAGVGYVAQEAFLFHDTIRANLAWVSPQSTDEDIWQALRLAQAEDFVRRMPAGLDTVVGDRGALVSGGERQRLALARALLRHPAVLILDEATSALDAEHEARIHDAIARLHEQMTIVVITHRLPTIRDADVIHVLDRGRLVQSGTWPDLAAAPGRFRDLLDAQGLAVEIGAGVGAGA
jgi:ATP-binding cassette subfamily C protein